MYARECVCTWVSVDVWLICPHLGASFSVSDRAPCLFIYIFCMYTFPNVLKKIDLIFICTLLLNFCKYFILFIIVLCKKTRVLCKYSSLETVSWCFYFNALMVIL